jgi:hypothetical protein
MKHERFEAQAHTPTAPIEIRIAELRAAVMDGKIKAQYAKIAIGELQQLEPDRHGNWRTLKPRTYALIAEQHDCKPRTARIAMGFARECFNWFGWRLVENGFVLKMAPDGRMVACVDARTSSPKENPRRKSFNKGKESKSGTLSKGKETNTPRATRPCACTAAPTIDTPKEVSIDEPAPIRLARWLALLSSEVIVYGISLGLTRREVLAVAERFANWYGAHLEREPMNLTAAFCGYRWMQRDAARKAAKHKSKRPLSAGLRATPDHAWPDNSKWPCDDVVQF